ncbi:MAG: hypothetical protein H6737_09685 [Alphaproteobacteria bacterium]|nr:hypothetical protein [Alphaproteobacteria bacterium]
MLLVLLVADMAAWSYAFSTGEIEAGRLLLYPDRMEGQPLVLSLVRVESVAEDRYVVRSGKQHLEVLGDPTGLRRGDEIYVGGVFHADGPRVEERWRELAPERGNKKLLGVLGLLAAAAVLPFALRVRADGLVLHG